jgi:hypothetical protein
LSGSKGEAIETQTTKVSKLRKEVNAGKARMEALEKERARLVAMEVHACTAPMPLAVCVACY